jgi:PDZ domain-containing protein
VSDSPTDPPVEPAAPRHPSTTFRLSRRGWTVLLSFVIFAALATVGTVIEVPYVSISPGPTYNTLGDDHGTPIVQIDGEQTHQTSGQLRMTTVSVKEHVTLFGAVAAWVAGETALSPREDYFPPGQSEEQVEQENKKSFQDSQSNAEVAALRALGKPIKVIAQSVTNKSPADGVIAPGDRLLMVNGHTINVQEDVRSALAGTTPGQTIQVTFRHGDEPDRTVSIKLGKASDFSPGDDRAEGFIGLGPADRADVPFKTTITLQDVGGPSAGLIFALSIVDKLTDGGLAGDRTIAGTGEIDVKGNVGRIGGIPFKMVSARDAGASVFLVPSDNCAEAKSKVPDGLQLIKVDTLEHAVQDLKDLKDGRPVPAC